MIYTRPLSSSERYLLASNEMCPDVTVHAFFDGSGVLDVSRWRRAVEIASAANPGSRLVLKGHLMFSRWVDSGLAPPVMEMDGSGWDAIGPEGGPAFLNEHLPHREGPTCQVILIHRKPLRVALRCHHAIMDGHGILTFADDIFRALRGEKPIGSDSRITDYELAKSFQKEGRIPPPHEYIAPTGMPEGGETGMVWRHVRMPGRFKHLIGQVAVLLAQAAWQHNEGKVRFGIPVDLRFRKPGLRSTANLTNLIYVDVVPGMTPGDIAQSVSRQIQDRRDGMLYWGDELVKYMPLGLIKRAIRREIAEKNASGRYRNSGILSNVGYIPMEIFQGGGFKTEYFWGTVTGQEFLPIFIGMAYIGDGASFIFSMPRSLASNGRFDAIIEHIRQGLVPSSSRSGALTA